MKPGSGPEGAVMARTLADHLDSTIQELSLHVAERYQWLLLQTLYTGSSRRRGLAKLPIEAKSHGLDIGTGFGVMAIEMAAAFDCFVDGIDLDPAVLTYAQQISAPLAEIQPRVHWIHTDIHRLPYANHSQDFITARFVLQHISHPEELLHELFRVVRPGGFIYVEDIDDSLILQYPTPPQSWQNVMAQFARLQEIRGGDRQVGRKLPVWLAMVGFSVQWVHPEWQSSVHPPHEKGPALEWELLRVEDVLPALYGADLLSPPEWEQGRADLLRTQTNWSFEGNASLQILAFKP